MQPNPAPAPACTFLIQWGRGQAPTVCGEPAESDRHGWKDAAGMSYAGSHPFKAATDSAALTCAQYPASPVLDLAGTCRLPPGVSMATHAHRDFNGPGLMACTGRLIARKPKPEA